MILLMNKKLILKYLLIPIVSLVLLIFFFVSIDPEGKPLIYIFIPVVLLWVFLFTTLQGVLMTIFKNKSQLRSILSVAGVSTIVLLILLSGVNQLTTADVILSFGLVFIGSFYFYRMWS
jgi:hypothetical protein